MAISAARVSVTTTPTLLTVGRDRDGGPGRSVAIYNPGPETVYLGDEDVDTVEGFALTAEADFAIDTRAGELLYGIVATTDQDVNVIQGGV